jgi:hypothetical protein
MPHHDTCRGAREGCDGCDICIERVTTRTLRVARKARAGILPGDLVEVTVGFEYQAGGGKRLGYFTREHRVGYGQGHHPALQGLGWRGRPHPHPIPPEAVERDALAARAAALRSDAPATVAEAEAGVGAARALQAAIEAFLALVPAEVARVVRPHLERDRPLDLWYVPRAAGLVAVAEGRVAHLRRAEAAAAWAATGLAWRGAGEVIAAPDGRRYRLGATWSRWVPHSSMEYMGESVDGEVVGGRSLLDPDTGAVVLRWRRGDALPHQGQGL